MKFTEVNPFSKKVQKTINKSILSTIKNKNSSEYKLEIPEIDLTEPLSSLVRYIFKSIKEQNNKIFKNNLNLNITKTLKKLS